MKVKDLGTTTMVYPAGELTFAVYVAGGPTFVTVRVMVKGFRPRFV